MFHRNAALIVCLALIPAAITLGAPADRSAGPNKAARGMPEVTGQRLSDIRLRDPFILSMPEEGVYYLFGTGWHLPGGPGFMVYRSKDLETFHGPTPAFCRPKGFWADRDYWAPEVHPYKGKYFMFASFKAGKACRGTQILVADAPAGPYRPYSDGPVTPRDWECLDGTLFIDRQNQPWIVFCHEWLQVGDGEMCAMPLRDDLKKASGSPILLFHASEAPWVVEVGVKPRGRVTDGPFLHRTSDGTLLMLWSSGGKRGYATGVARSESGTIRGPWRQESQPLYADDGGHGMIFHKHDGALMLALHQPNKKPDERPRLFRLQEKDGRLVILP